MKHLLLCLGLAVAATVWSDPYPDDVGDTPAEAALLSVGTGSLQRVAGIEPDTDVDWFYFIARPGISYRVEAATSGVWDVSLQLRAPDGQTLWSQTNSAYITPPAKATLTWTNAGAAGPCYLGVAGLFEFTTGSYQLVVSPLDYQDVDADGLPDVWEIQHFGSYTQHDGAADVDQDGLSNEAEYAGLTQPTNAASGLAITSIGQSNGTVSVGWPAAPWARYAVETGSNLAAGVWQEITTRLRTNAVAGTEVVEFPSVGPGTVSVFRVEYRIAPTP